MQDQSNRTNITNVTVSENEFRVDTYYTDNDELELMDSFTIRRTEAPVITVPSAEDGTTKIEVGQAFNPMTGVTAQDCDGNDLTERVFVTVYELSGSGETQVQYVDTSREGSYRIVYEVTDAYGKSAEAEQLVTVIADGGTTDPDNPGGSTDPDNPGGSTDPDTPGDGNQGGTDTPGSGQNGNNQTGESVQGGAVKTGDESLPSALYIVIMAAAATAGTAAFTQRRKKTK